MVIFRLRYTAMKTHIVTYHSIFIQENKEQNGVPAERGCRLLLQAEAGTGSELGHYARRAENGLCSAGTQGLQLRYRS